MSLSDYLLDSILILLVVRQMRTARYDRRAMILPLAVVAVVGKRYLHGVPAHGHSLLLVCGLVAVGLVLGTCSALATRVWSDGGRYALVRAGLVSAALWVVGMGGRMAFSIWASHGGDHALTAFSLRHGITDRNAWTAALVLMALTEVVSRVGVLYLRGRRALAAQPPAGSTPSRPAELASVRG